MSLGLKHPAPLQPTSITAMDPLECLQGGWTCDYQHAWSLRPASTSHLTEACQQDQGMPVLIHNLTLILTHTEMTRAVVLMPSALVCRKHSPYRHAIEAALVAQSAGAGGNTVDWQWQEPDGGGTCTSSHNGSSSSRGVASTMTTNSLQAQAQALLKSDPNVDLVLVPSLEPPYQAHYFTRVFRGEADSSSNSGIIGSNSKKRAAPASFPADGSSFSPSSFIIHMTTLRLAPTERTYLTATALCRHFGWGHVALLSSDDNHMQAAQGLRQQLTSAGIHIRRHHIFSPTGGGSLHSKSNPSPPFSSGSSVAHDLDAIRASGARIVFLLSSCRATHEVLSAARRKAMLRDYAWVVLHPTSACALDSSSPLSSSPSSAKGMDDNFEGGDLALLEMYQGVLGLAWDGAMAAGDAAWPKVGVEINTSAIPLEAIEALDGFCRDSRGSSSNSREEAEAADTLDLSPGVLYEALRHLASPSSSSSSLSSSSSSLSASSLDGVEGVGSDGLEEGVVLHPHLAVSVLSFSGARRASSPSTSVSTGIDSSNSSSSSSNSSSSGHASRIEVIHQPIARLAMSSSSSSSSSPSSSSIDGFGRLELLTKRPLRWPGDVRAQPRDLAEVWGNNDNDFFSSASRSSNHDSLTSIIGVWPLVFCVAAICIALTPLWNWLYKRFLKAQEPSPPCLDGGSPPIPALSEVKDAASQEEDRAFIAARMAELTEKQMELLRSVEVDMRDVVMKKHGGGIGQGSFSVVYKGYYQNSHVAIKVLKKVDERNFRRFLEEILLHKELRHPNVVMFRGTSWRDGRLLMLVDFAGRGTLADVLRRSQGTVRWKPVKLNMALGIARGMAFLHQTRYYDMWTSSYQRCVVHRDLKPQNILVTDAYHVQITDFGEARTVDHENTMTQVGTQLFVAPEVVRGERYSEKCDVYSFAVVLLAMLELRPDVLDVFAEALPDVEKSETGITRERMKEPQGVEVTDACKTCPLNKGYQPPPGMSLAQAQAAASTPEHECPLAQHKEFKGVVAHAVTRAVVYDDLRPTIKGCPYPGLKTLIEKCWIPDENDRPSFAAVVEALDGRIRREVSDYTRSTYGSSGSHSNGSGSGLSYGSTDLMMLRDGLRQGGGRVGASAAGNGDRSLRVTQGSRESHQNGGTSGK